MDFSDMGQLDANAEIQKGAVHSASVKGATVRLSDDFLELLNIIAGEVGLSRQAFMSKVIENFSAQAVADYLIGYSSSINTELDAQSFFADAAVDNKEMKNHLDRFANRVDDLMIDWLAYVEGVKALPQDNPKKLAYMHKQRRVIKERFPDATFEFDLPPLEEEK